MFKKDFDKISFISTIDGLETLEDCLPKPAKHYIPKWFKDIPSAIPMTVKACPSFPDFFSQGYVIPMWCDVRLTHKEEDNSWNWQTSSDVFVWQHHENHQLIDYVTPNFMGVDGQYIFKAISPWRIITPPGWSVLQLPLFYHFNRDWSVLPGVIDSDIHSEINQQVLYHGNGSTIEINRGEPFVMYIPYKRSNTLKHEVRFQNDKDRKYFNKEFLGFGGSFRPNGYYRQKQRNRDKN